MLYLSEIWIYPIKSLEGISLSSSKIDQFGLQHDRRWMLVDESGKFISQRTQPKLALLKTRLNNQLIRVESENSFIEIPLRISTTNTLKVKVWDDFCASLLASTDINDWFSNFLGINCQLVYLPDTSHRQVDSQYAHNQEKTSFTDGFPFLLIGQSSLNDLNSHLEKKVPMSRFRPNLVFKGGDAFEEDNWNTFKIGTTIFRRAKPCSRCIMTTIEDGRTGKEPLKTLSSYRKHKNKIYFGQNLVAISGTEISKDEIIELL